MKRFVVLCLALAALHAAAQGYPSKPVRMVITFPPGGPSEILTRLVAERLQPVFGQPFVIENRAGAGGNVGADAVAKSPADGHTFGITTDTLFDVNPLVYARMPFDAWRDITPVTLLGSFSQMMVCNPKLGVKTLAELLSAAKRERLTYASGGAGVPGHLAAELLLTMTGSQMVHVPYKGPAAAATDVMGGQVHCGFLATPTVLPHVKAGRLTALAVSTAQRSPLAPDVPTAAEAGVAGFDAPFFLVMFAPGGIDAAILKRMSDEFSRALATPELRQRAAQMDVTTLGGSPEQAAATLRAAAAKWDPVVKRIGLKLD